MKKKKPLWKRILITTWIILLLAEVAQLLVPKELPTFLGGVTQSDAGTELMLQNLAATDADIAVIYENREAYPVDLLTALENNPEIKEFVMGYLQAEPVVTGGFSEEELAADFPLLLQWDKRWGYVPYGKNNIGVAGCGPTCLSMVVLALTGDEEATPDVMAEYSLENGHYVKGEGTAWSLMTEGARDFGLLASEVSLDEEAMQGCLDNGNLIICAMRKGDFTTSGHFIVIYGYNEEGFLVNDPNSISRSEMHWDFATLKGQIKNMWAYSCIE